LPLIFGIPAHQITNKILDSDEIKQYADLNNFCKIVLSTTLNAKSINMILRNRLSGTKNYDEQFISLIRSSNSVQSGQEKIFDSLSKTIFTSQRNFERKFKHYSGFTPKSFSNLLRSTSSLAAISFDQKKISQTAFEKDYFDHAHFSNEFKKHTGFQPKGFVRGSKEEKQIWNAFVDFFQFLSICPPVLCKNKNN
jgi:AraC-like DNA-binding protein